MKSLLLPLFLVLASGGMVLAAASGQSITGTDNFQARLYAAIWGAITGGIMSLLVSLLFNVLLPRFRRYNLTRHISIVADPTHHFHTRFRVRNGGYWTISDATLYLSLDIQQQDTLPVSAHIHPEEFAPLREDQLCWSVRSPTKHPLKVAIYAKELQPFSPCRICPDRIEIPSEEGWDGLKRVVLKRRRYTGTLKLVSADTNAKCFSLVIDPDSPSNPCVIKPSD